MMQAGTQAAASSNHPTLALAPLWLGMTHAPQVIVYPDRRVLYSHGERVVAAGCAYVGVEVPGAIDADLGAFDRHAGPGHDRAFDVGIGARREALVDRRRQRRGATGGI